MWVIFGVKCGFWEIFGSILGRSRPSFWAVRGHFGPFRAFDSFSREWPKLASTPEIAFFYYRKTKENIKLINELFVLPFLNLYIMPHLVFLTRSVALWRH